MIGQHISGYKILEKLGEGGMGVVYLAEDTKLERQVAIKFLPRDLKTDSEQRRRFQTEAKAAASLNHPHIGTIYSIEEYEYDIFLTMEYIAGKELKQILATHRDQNLPFKDIIKYAIQIATGLQAAHKKGIVHRDIKPSNIMLTNEGAIKIMDFGLAKFRGSAQLTKTGTTLGTVAYMSPEQTLGEKVDQRSDIWSFGVLLHEMLSGQLPFQGDYDPAIQYSIVNSDPEPLSHYIEHVPDGLQQIIDKTLAKDPDNRYQSCEELITDLQVQIGAQPAVIKKVSHKSRLVLPVAALAALVIICAVYFLNPFALFTRQAVRTIAVLPFIDLSADKDQEYFADGLAEELLNILARNPQLQVTSRTSTFSFKGSNIDLRTIAGKLNVDHILEGSVRKAGNQIRVTTQLIDVATDAHLWSQTYDQSLENIFTVQENISRSVAEALRVKLLGEDQQMNQIKTNVDAYNAFLKAEYFQRQFHDKESLDKAVRFYKQALEIDPDYVRAWVGLGGVYVNQILAGYCSEACYSRAGEAADRALNLDPKSADALCLKGFMAMTFEWDLKKADTLLQRSLQLEPENAIILSALATLFGRLGRFEKAIALDQRALELDPLNHITRNNLGVEYYYAGQLEKAEKTLRELIELNPKYFGIHIMISGIFLLKGEPDSAVVEMMHEVDPGLRLYGFSLAYHAASKPSNADSTLTAFIKDFSPAWDFQIAEVYAYRNEPDKAFEYLESAYRQRDPGFLRIKVSPFLQNIRHDPRYNELLNKIDFDVVMD